MHCLVVQVDSLLSNPGSNFRTLEIQADVRSFIFHTPLCFLPHSGSLSLLRPFSSCHWAKGCGCICMDSWSQSRIFHKNPQIASIASDFFIFNYIFPPITSTPSPLSCGDFIDESVKGTLMKASPNCRCG